MPDFLGISFTMKFLGIWPSMPDAYGMRFISTRSASSGSVETCEAYWGHVDIETSPWAASMALEASRSMVSDMVGGVSAGWGN